MSLLVRWTKNKQEKPNENKQTMPPQQQQCQQMKPEKTTTNKLAIQIDSNCITIVAMFFLFDSHLDPCSVCWTIWNFFSFLVWLFKDHDLMLKSEISLFWLLAGETNANILEPYSTQHTRGCIKYIHVSYGTHHLDAFRTQTDTIHKNQMYPFVYITLFNIYSFKLKFKFDATQKKYLKSVGSNGNWGI